jgi:riboflavin kinase/FMN adenylyltransferase
MAMHCIPWQALSPAACRGGVVAIGNFDGVHRGHASLIAELRRQANAYGAPAVVLTFDPHPLQLLRPELFMPVLTTLGDRSASLEAAGADQVVVLGTDRELLALEAADFVEEVLVKRFAGRGLVEGPNFRFGRERGGDLEQLARLCQRHDMTLTIVEPFLLGELPVSSSRVRTALQQGDVRESAELLGRPYCLHGQVIKGQERGQRLGFPTANLGGIQTVIPADGVYAVRARAGQASWAAAANIGPNPTFGEQDRKVEVHLIDFHGDLYGQSLAIDFLERLRDTRPFPDVETLIGQLQQDIAAAQRIASSVAGV